MNYVKIHKNKFYSNENENNILNDVKIYFFKNDLKASNYYITKNFKNYNLQLEKHNYIFISLDEYLKYNENINEIRKQEKINKKKLNSINKLNKINNNVSDNSSIQLSFSNLNDLHSNEDNNHSENNRSVTYSFRNVNKINYNISNLEKQNEKNSIKKNKSAFPNLKKKLKKSKDNENKIIMNKDEIYISKKIKEKLYELIIDYSKKKNKKPPNNYKEKNDEEKNKMKEEIMIKMSKLNFDEIKHINRVLKNENFRYEIELNEEEEELYNKGINIDNLNSLQLKYLDDLVNCFVAYNDLFNIKNYIDEKKEMNLNKKNKENYLEDENNNFYNKNNKKIINDDSIDSEEKEEENEDDDEISNNDIYQQRVIYNHEKNNNDNIFAEI